MCDCCTKNGRDFCDLGESGTENTFDEVIKLSISRRLKYSSIHHWILKGISRPKFSANITPWILSHGNILDLLQDSAVATVYRL